MREIFRDHAPFVLRVLRRLGVPERDLKDQGQEVFVIVHRKIHQLDAPDGVRAWLFVIARGVASDYRRKAHVRREVPTDDLGSEVSVGSTAEDDLDRQRARARLDVALDALATEKREVFVLYQLEELSMKEVAQMVGCPLQTAYSRLHAARDQVAKVLRRESATARGRSKP